MNGLVLWILSAIAAGMSWVFLLPDAWFIPAFLAAILATLIFGFIANLGVKDDRPVKPIVSLVASFLSVPSRPLAKVPEGWALQCFFVCVAFVLSLGLSVVLRANISL
ncbi:hypothetical protein GJ699_03400 [Duganella sp. FT80W]|uniref:Uncharacterized protein n=1 Tax=Duganella guangzhouensis TaxID=2666084 RepID=A0A6I2KU95_9BURK|nr:hypothetical protein [Duganella guangzhouensis]MRW89022.1 hypothetical protein [Duganella guangzhouensis]